MTDTLRKSQEESPLLREDLLAREGLSALICTLLIALLALLFEPALGPPGDPLETPSSVRAPWIFLWVQWLLRYGPVLAAGLALPCLLFGTLAALPWIAPVRGSTGLWLAKGHLTASLILLGILGLAVSLSLLGLLTSP
jgi:hypothetical protein